MRWWWKLIVAVEVEHQVVVVEVEAGHQVVVVDTDSEVEHQVVVVTGGIMVRAGHGTQAGAIGGTGGGGGLAVVDLVGEVAAAFHPQLLLFQIN
ncbi:MAG: hypothetical protein ACK5RQ_06805 [Bacteroidota bacterium]